MMTDFNPYAAGNLIDEPALVEVTIPLSPARRWIGKWALWCSGLSLLGIILAGKLIDFVSPLLALACVAAVWGLVITSIVLTLVDLWCFRPRRSGAIMITCVVVAFSILGVLVYWMDEFRHPNET